MLILRTGQKLSSNCVLYEMFRRTCNGLYIIVHANGGIAAQRPQSRCSTLVENEPEWLVYGLTALCFGSCCKQPAPLRQQASIGLVIGSLWVRVARPVTKVSS